MIGTTDREYHGDPAQVSITEQEIAYVLGVANTHFRKQLEPRDIVHTFAGVRPCAMTNLTTRLPSPVTTPYRWLLRKSRRRCSRYSAAN